MNTIMMPDARAIGVITTLNLLVITLGMGSQWLRERAPCVRDWTLAFLVSAVGNLLTSLRDILPVLLTVTLGGTLLLSSYVLVYTGLCRLFETAPRRSALALPGLTCALYLYFTAVQHSPIAWPAILGYMRFLICALIIQLLLTYRSKMSPHASLVLLFSVGAMGLFMLARASLGLIMPTTGDYHRSSVPAITYMVVAACTIGMMVGLMSLYVDQLLLKLANTANTDVLTGLSNRRYFTALARLEFERSRRMGSSAWLLLIDIDHFKRINDNFGHAEGDQVLKQVGSALSDAVRRYDLVARYGGEEFSVFLPHTTEDEARAIAHRLLQAVAQLPLPGDAVQTRVTISIGAAPISTDDRGLDCLLKRADDALYQAKSAGRNRISGFAT